ncbi:MAG: DoxX-like family protein [Chlorobi bacterium]|nr:DoxX-like family protein [Chlorobiota bacterium]
MQASFVSPPALLISRMALSFSWIYQGAVPKLACRSSGEIDLLGHVIPVYEWACMAVGWMGAGEIIFGLILLFTRRIWVYRFNIVALTALLVYVLIFEPDLFTEPFNPLTLNVSLIGLSLIAILELKKLKETS